MKPLCLLRHVTPQKAPQICAFALSTLIAGPAFAWEFKSGQPCTLTHETGQAGIVLTYDPTGPLYGLSITRNTPWPDGAVFRMRFDGPQGREIGTTQHRLSTDGRTLSVSDRGFGNVLDGLQFNHTATAFIGGQEVSFPLDGAAEEVAAFRACDGLPLVS